MIETVGDTRCILFGHLARLAVWQLRPTWRDDVPVVGKLERIKKKLHHIYPLDLLHRLASQTLSSLSDADLLASMRVGEVQATYDHDADMEKLLEATQGKVFTLKTLDYLVESTALKKFKSR